MSDLNHIVAKYARNEASLVETAQALASLHLLAPSIHASSGAGTWQEVEHIFNAGILSFSQYRELDREYRKAKIVIKKFVILGLDYGFVEG